MSVSLLASSALGSIGKELDNGKQTAKALFPTDAIMSAMLAAAPAGILTVMLLFSPQLYSETGLDTVYYNLVYRVYRVIVSNIKLVPRD